MARIVVADDEEDIRLLIRILLLKSGHEVAEAKDGEEALEVVRRYIPDLVLLDIRMPKMTGLEAFSILKGDAVTSAIPVLIVSAYAQEGDVDRGMQMGAEGYITKPFQPQELLARINGVLETSTV